MTHVTVAAGHYTLSFCELLYMYRVVIYNGPVLFVRYYLNRFKAAYRQTLIGTYFETRELVHTRT